LQRSDDGGDTWTVMHGSPSDIRSQVIASDGRAVAFTGSQEIWTAAEPGGWELAGTTPVLVAKAVAWDCPGGLTVQAEYGSQLYFTRTLGQP
jgi:hypothetical protein